MPMHDTLPGISFSYGFAGVPLKYQVVFKSIMALLTGRTIASWSYTDSQPADLLIIGLDSATNNSIDASARAVLFIGDTQDNHSAPHLHLPLRAHEVLEYLNQAASNLKTVTGIMVFHMLRWPLSSILQEDVRYLRLATLLASRDMSLQELCNRSSTEPAICEQFISRMRDSALLQQNILTPEAQANVDPAPPQEESLFARIRRKIGL